jgi:hypothetical protein
MNYTKISSIFSFNQYLVNLVTHLVSHLKPPLDTKR